MDARQPSRAWYASLSHTYALLTRTGMRVLGGEGSSAMQGTVVGRDEKQGKWLIEWSKYALAASSYRHADACCSNKRSLVTYDNTQQQVQVRHHIMHYTHHT